MGIGSQLDGLGHIGIDGTYYNGHQAKDFAAMTGLTKLGIEKVPPITTRGVLLDMAAPLRHRCRQGRHRPSTRPRSTRSQRSRASRSARGDVVLFPHRLDQPDRQGRQTLFDRRAGPRPREGRALSGREGAWSRSAPTAGRWR